MACIGCGVDITHKAPQARRCDECRRLAQIEARKKWNRANREVGRKAVRKWEAQNPAKRRQYRAQQRPVLVRATPPWVNPDWFAPIYAQCPEGMQVDHIVPLAGTTVSGLHVPWNLQYLTPQENKRKGNRL